MAAYSSGRQYASARGRPKASEPQDRVLVSPTRSPRTLLNSLRWLEAKAAARPS